MYYFFELKQVPENFVAARAYSIIFAITYDKFNW